MTQAEITALALVGTLNNEKELRRMITNSRGKSDLVEKAAFRRLIAISAQHLIGTIEYDCWSMIHTVEELRRTKGRRVYRMNRLRPKIKKDGEIAGLEYCAINETDGFFEILGYGMPELTAEAIVIRHGSPVFSINAISAARARLSDNNIDPDQYVGA